MENISTHISWDEATRSETATRFGISNTPTPKHLEAMKLLAEKVFEPLREAMGSPIRVTSFYRSQAVNDALKGASATSQHCKGEAIDIVAAAGKTNKELFTYIVNNLDFDQIIWEAGSDSNPEWVHVSYKAAGNRKQILQMKRVGGKPKYYAKPDLSFIK